MNKTTTLILVALGALFLWKRTHAAPKLARVGELGEEQIFDGTNWTGNAWATLETAADFKDITAPNLTGAANADPGKVGQAQLGIQPGWDGSL